MGVDSQGIPHQQLDSVVLAWSLGICFKQVLMLSQMLEALGPNFGNHCKIYLREELPFGLWKHLGGQILDITGRAFQESPEEEM